MGENKAKRRKTEYVEGLKELEENIEDMELVIEKIDELGSEIDNLMLVPGAEIATFGKVSKEIKELVQKHTLKKK